MFTYRHQHMSDDFYMKYNDYLVTWSNKARGYVWMYSQPEINVYQHICLIAAALNAGVNFTVTLLPQEDQELSLFVIGIVNIITLTFTAFYKIFTSKDIPIEKQVTMDAWRSLLNRIERQRMFNAGSKEECEEFLSFLFDEYQRLQESSPPLSHKIFKQYKDALAQNVNP